MSVPCTPRAGAYLIHQIFVSHQALSSAMYHRRTYTKKKSRQHRRHSPKNPVNLERFSFRIQISSPRPNLNPNGHRREQKKPFHMNLYLQPIYIPTPLNPATSSTPYAIPSPTLSPPSPPVPPTCPTLLPLSLIRLPSINPLNPRFCRPTTQLPSALQISSSSSPG